MHIRPPFMLSLLAFAAVALTHCTNVSVPSPADEGSFASARNVLEAKCVHCHGKERLANMPPFGSTAALAKLKADGVWLVAGKPERSRMFQVVTLTDEQIGAMPPTGHAISKAEVALLRAWIANGAPLPEGRSVTLKPQGTLVRSN